MEENQVKKEDFSKLESLVIDFTQKRIDDSREEYESLYFVDGKLREDANAEEVKAKEDALAGLEEEKEEVKSKLKDYKEAIAIYEKEMLEHDKEIQKLEQELEKIAKELEEAQKEDPIDEDKIEKLNTHRENVEGKITGLKEDKEKIPDPAKDYKYTGLIGWLMSLMFKDKGLNNEQLKNGVQKYIDALTCEYRIDACKEMNDELQKEEEQLYGEHEELNEDKNKVVEDYNRLIREEQDVATGAGAGSETKEQEEPKPQPQAQPQQPPRPQPQPQQQQAQPQPQSQPAAKPEPQTRVNPEPVQTSQPAPAPKPTRAELDRQQNELMKKLKEIEDKMSEISEKIADIQDTQKLINDRIQENQQELYTIEAELYTLLEMDPAELDRNNEGGEERTTESDDDYELEYEEDGEESAPYKIDISKTVTIDFNGVVCEFNPNVVREARHVTGSDIEEILSLASKKFGVDDVTLQGLIDSKKVDVSLIKLMQLNDEISEDNINLMISDYIKASIEPKTQEQIEEQKEFAGLFDINYDLRKGLNSSLFQARLSNEDKSRVVEAAKWGVRTGIVEEIPADKDYKKSLMERIRDIRFPWQEKVEQLPEPSSMSRDVADAQEHAEQYNDMLNDKDNETQSDIISKAVVEKIKTGDGEVLDLAKDGEVKPETDIERIRRIEQERKAKAAENARNAAHRETDDSRTDRSDDDFEDIE